MMAMPIENTWTVLVAGTETGGRFAIVEARERQGSASPLHMHSREDEFIYVLEGEVAVERDEKQIRCPAGTWMYLPRGCEHAVAASTPDARMLVLFSPAGIEQCLAELGMNARDSADDEQIELLVCVAARYGVAITGPGRPP